MAETVAGVHTHTHTHGNFNNKKVGVLNEEMNKLIKQVGVPIIVALIIEIFFAILNGGFLAVVNCSPDAIFFSILIIYLIYGILIGITKRLSISTIITSILATVFLTINQIKIAYTQEPIVFSDLNFIPNINGIFSMVSNDILVLAKYYLLTVILLIIAFYLIIRWTQKNDLIVNNIKIRSILIIVSIIVFVILFIPNKYTKTIFLNKFLPTEDGEYTTYLSYCDDYSLLAGIYGILLNDRLEEPENYNEEQLNKILEYSDETQTTGALGQPNIIVVFSESFWDIDKQSDVTFNEVVAPNIKRLKQEGKLVEILSCAYGRKSENIAFELLTGGSLNYFTDGYIPIMSLYKRENSEEIISIVKELKENNYRSKIVFGEDYYNSEETMKKLGFDEYIDVETPESVENANNISDEYMINLIINELENKEDDEKIFYMTETIQNHMPYEIEKYVDYDISIKQSSLSSEENDTILSYAQGVHDADEQLNRLYEYIQTYEEPTILIFLGDHLPYLYTTKGDNALESISYFNTGDELEDTYRKYNTQALILSNYDIDLNEMPNYLSNNLLLTYIVNNMDIELSSYYKWLYTTTWSLPATNSYISLDTNGKKYNTQELQEDMQVIYELRKNMQYKFFIKPTQ